MAIDCIGLIICVGQDLGLDLQGDKDDYKVLPDQATCDLIEFIENNKFIREDGPGEGRIVLFTIARSKFPCHTAILSEGGKNMIHSMNYNTKQSTLCKVREHIFSMPWTKRVHSYWSYPRG